MEVLECTDEDITAEPLDTKPLTEVMTYSAYKKLLELIFILFKQSDISKDEIKQFLNRRELFKDFKYLWLISSRHNVKKNKDFNFENWKTLVANNPEVIDYLYAMRDI